MITVVNIKNGAPYTLYIGRANRTYNVLQSIWANPFKTGVDGTRDEVLEKYREWIRSQPDLMNQLHVLDDQVLGCWCAPKRCHGHVLAELRAEQQREEQLREGILDIVAWLNEDGIPIGWYWTHIPYQLQRESDGLKTTVDIDRNRVVLETLWMICRGHRISREQIWDAYEAYRQNRPQSQFQPQSKKTRTPVKKNGHPPTPERLPRRRSQRIENPDQLSLF